MKITASELTFSASQQFESLDGEFQEKSVSRQLVSTPVRQFSASNDTPTMIVDRVTLLKSENQVQGYAFSSSLTSSSSVTNQESEDEDISFEQKSAMETLVGSILDRQVVVESIQKGTAVDLSSSGSSDSINTPGAALSQKISSQMRIDNTQLHFEQEQLTVNSTGVVQTEDGRTIDFSLGFSLDRTYLSQTQQTTLIQRTREEIQLTDPLVISLDGSVPSLSDTTFSFDLDMDGDQEEVHFVNAGSGFLAFDKNGDNEINDGSELFGPQSGNGFSDLAELDDDQNGWIDENDAAFSQLSVWTMGEDGEPSLISLKDAGVGAISLSYAENASFNLTDSENTLEGQLNGAGIFLFENGNVGSINQIDLAAQEPETADSQLSEQTDAFVETQTIPVEGTSTVLPAAATADIPEAAGTPEAENPLKQLLDQIKELKEKMEQIFEKMSLAATDEIHGSRRSRHGRGRLSKNPMMFQADPSILMSGYGTGPVRSRRYHHG